MTSTPDARERTGFAGIQALQSRSAGYSVARECLVVQAAAEARDPSLRTDDGVRLHPDAWSWYVGALGEIEVGEILAQLGPEWFIRHAVPIGSGATDVDHLLIGPSGVFALNTKRHLGASVWVGDFVLKVNGGNTHHLKYASSEAANVCRRLTNKVGFPVVAHSVLVVVGARTIKDIRDPQNRPTSVIHSRDLIRWIKSQPATLAPSELELVRLAAEEPGTWHIDPHAAETLRVMPRFQRLREEVGDNPVSPTKQNAAPSRHVPTRVTSARRPKLARVPTVTKPHRSRAERIFWRFFFTLVGIPVGLITLGLVIGLIATIARG